MKHKKILGVIERSQNIKKSSVCNFERRTKDVGFTNNYVFMYVNVFGDNEDEQVYRIRLNARDKKYFASLEDPKGWRSFSASVNKLNNGNLKMVLDTHMYM